MTTSSRRLLLIGTSYAVGGLGQIIVSLARSLRATGWATRCVFPDAPERDAALGWCRDQGVDAEMSVAVRDIVDAHSLQDLRNLRNLCRATGAAVVNLHYGGSHISVKDVLAVRLAGARRCVVSVHHPTPWSEAGPQKRRMTRLAAMMADAVVVNSGATARVLREAGVPAHKMARIPCGVPVPMRQPDRTDARRRLGVSPTAFVVSTLARLVPAKGVADLVEALGRLAGSDHDLRLLVAGDGPERQALEQLARARLGDRATFLGRVRGTEDLYAAADVFALPSYLEGFGLVYVEAAFHGVPSVGTRVGGVPDAVLDGETGLLVPAGDIAAITGAISRLRDDPALRHRLGTAARDRAHRECTEAVMAARYENVFMARERTRAPRRISAGTGHNITVSR